MAAGQKKIKNIGIKECFFYDEMMVCSEELTMAKDVPVFLNKIPY